MRNRTGGVIRRLGKLSCFLAVLLPFFLVAQQSTTGWSVAVLDQILAATPPGQKTAQVDDMEIPVGTLRVWRNRLAGGRQTQSAFDATVQTWADGRVYYNFDGSVNTLKQRVFLDCAAEWALFANLQFIARTTQANYITVRENPAISGGVSAVGMVGGQQFVDFGSNGWSHYVALHELGHALGLIHEQNRSDRDSYIQVLTNNVAPTYTGFFIVPIRDATTYDFHSIMHYGFNSGAIDPSQPTMVPLPQFSQFAPVGNREIGLTPLDRAGIAGLYGPGPPLGAVVTNTQDSGPGSLRAALYFAYDHPGTTVSFDIPSTDPNFSNGIFTIYVTDTLPPLVNATTVDGATQPGAFSLGYPVIRLNGSRCDSVSTIAKGFEFRGTNCHVRGMIIDGFNRYGILLQKGASANVVGGPLANARNYIHNNGGSGVMLVHSGTRGNLVQNNHIGLDVFGNRSPNAFYGIEVTEGASTNVIGGTAASTRNTVSGNSQIGIYVYGNNTIGNMIMGNYVGLHPDGVNPMGNSGDGIRIGAGAKANIVGGAEAGAGNIIGGNDGSGISLREPGTINNVIQGNLIGLNSSGTAAVSNAFYGIEIFNGAQSNSVTGRNIVAGNRFSGIALHDIGTLGNLIQSNWVGFSALGSGAVPNGAYGVEIFAGSASNVIGGGNFISGNGNSGVALRDVSTVGNVLTGNVIGLNAAFGTALPNNGSGVIVTGGAKDNTIGGTAMGAGNVIASNTAHGVELWDAGTTNNSVRGNSVMGNAGQSIVLNGSANRAATPPSLSSLSVSTTNITVSGALNGTPNAMFWLDFYSSLGNPAQGGVYLGTVSVTTDAVGSAPFNAGLGGTIAGGSIITATATDLFGNTSGMSSGVTVLQPIVAPAIVVQPQGQAVVAGNNVTFAVVATGTVPLSYQWRFNGTNLAGATAAGYTRNNVQTNHAGSYDVVVSNVAGSATSAAAVLTVSAAPAAPSITVQPAGQTVVAGTNVTLSVTATGTAPLNYQWRSNGVALAGATNATLVFNNIQTNAAATYSVVITNSVGSVTSANAVLVVNAPPVITTQPAGQGVVAGNNVTFTVVATGTAPLSYQWRFNGTNLAGATGASYTRSNVQTNHAGSYDVVVSNVAGSATSAAAVLTVSAAPVAPSITGQPAGQTVVAGTNVTLSVTATGTAPLSYQWRSNGVALAGATNATLVFNNIQTNAAATYSVVITNSVGSVTSGNAVLVVNAPPVITTQPVSQSVVAGTNVTFTVVVTGTAPLSYQWRFNGTNLAGATAAGYTRSNVQTNHAGSYDVVVSNVAGTVTSAGAVLTVTPVPTAPTITLQPTNQTVVAGTNAGIVVVATGTVPLSYQWWFNGNPLAGATNALLSLPNVQAGQAGGYSVGVSNSVGGVTSAVAQLTVLVPPAITTQPQGQAVVAGGNVTLSVLASGTAPLFYQWRVNGTNLAGATASSYTLASVQTNHAGLYDVVVSNVAGTATSAGALLIVSPAPVPPTLTLQATNQAVVAGSNVTFVVAAAGTLPLSYQWRFNGSPLAGATNASLDLANVQAGQEGGYAVVVTNSAGSVTSSVVQLTVIVPPAITTPPQSRAAAAGGDASFTVVATGTAPLAYQWRFEGTNLPGATNASFTLAGVQTAHAGVYDVVVSNAGGTVTSSAATLVLGGAPFILVPPRNTGVLVGNLAVFTVSADGDAPLAYQWRKDGTNLAGQTFVQLSLNGVTTNDIGAYSVVITNAFGAITSAPALLAVGQLSAPLIQTQPQSQTVFAGTNVLLGVSATGIPTPNYQWIKDGFALLGANDPTLTLTNVTPADSGNYRVQVFNDAGLTNSDLAVLNVWVFPTLDTPPQPQTVIEDGTAVFAVVVSGVPVPTLQWYRNGLRLTNSPNYANVIGTNLLVLNASSNQLGSYSVVASSAAGSVTSAPVSLNVVFPPRLTSQPTNATVRTGSNAVFTVTVSGTPPFDYQWRFNATNLPNETNAVLTLTGATTNHAGPYSVVITNLAGSVTSANALLTVIPPAVAPVITSQPMSLVSIAGANLTLLVEAAGTPPLLYGWWKDGSNLPGASNAVLTLTNVRRVHSGIYQATVSNEAGGVVSSNAVMWIRVPQRLQPPVMQPGGVFRLAFGDEDGGQVTTNDLARYEVQAATNLVNPTNWITLTNALLWTNGSLLLEDANAVEYRGRFYRVIER